MSDAKKKDDSKSPRATRASSRLKANSGKENDAKADDENQGQSTLIDVKEKFKFVTLRRNYD